MDEYLQQIGDIIQTTKEGIVTADQGLNFLQKLGKQLGKSGFLGVPGDKRIRNMINWEKYADLKNAQDSLYKEKAVLRAILNDIDRKATEQKELLYGEAIKAIGRGENISIKEIDEELDFCYNAIKKKLQDSMDEFDAQQYVIASTMIEVAKWRSV